MRYPPPRSQRQRNEKKSNKMEASSFRCIRFFSLLMPVYLLFSFNRAMLFIISQIKKRVLVFKTKQDYQMVRPKKNA